MKVSEKDREAAVAVCKDWQRSLSLWPEDSPVFELEGRIAEAIAAAYRRGLEDAANLVEDGDFLDHELAVAIRKLGEDA